MWLEGFLTALQGQNVLYLLFGTLIGIIVGVIPGVSASFGVALMLPFTFGMDSSTAIIFLAAIHAASVYGDSITSILLNTPGGVGSVPSCWDGHPLARQGKAGMALGVATLGSFVGGFVGWLTLVFISPLITKAALSFSAAEYFTLALMALSLLAIAAQGETIKGVILGGLGLLLAFIGQDPVEGFDYRLTFGSTFLEDGLPIVPVTLGLFALSQVLIMASEGGSVTELTKLSGGIGEGIKETVKRPLTMLRGGVIGIFMGIMPALGVSIATIIAYMVEKKSSRKPETFGKGNISGLLAPETSKGACVVGDLIPTFTLGIPGSVTTAILMAALMIHGLEPGPKFFLSGKIPYTIFSGIFLAQVAFFLVGIYLAGYFAKIMLIPNALIVPGLAIFSIIGAFASRNRWEDVIVAVVFGLLGYLLNRLKFPAACLVLGLVLGKMVEANFHRAILVGDGSYLVFFTRPISASLLAFTLVFLLWPYLIKLFQRRSEIFKTIEQGMGED